MKSFNIKVSLKQMSIHKHTPKKELETEIIHRTGFFIFHLLNEVKSLKD